MTRAELERAYDLLAVALDDASPDERALLARLVLVLAADCEDLGAFERALETARRAGDPFRGS